VHVSNARLKTRRLSATRAGASCGIALLAFLFGSKSLQNAVAEGDTRSISLHHVHTGEDITITFKRDGRYDDAALEKLNWFLRDWRKSEQTRMDPHLIDLVWEVQREAGSKEPIQVICGYRSPATNAMLRHHSSGVARYSQHMLGHAMDFFIPGVALEQLREYGLRLQRGGVGFYPESGSPFVHMDTAGIRMWPRMSREQLARVFPDGRTIHIPTDGKPLSGYALALADVVKSGGVPSGKSIEAARIAGVNVDILASNDPSGKKNPIAKLLGLGNDDENDESDAPTMATAQGAATVSWQAKPASPTAPDHGADKKPSMASQAAATAKVAIETAKLKLVHVSTLARPSAPAAPTPPAANAAPSPNQVIAARGYWQGPPDGAAAANPLAAKPLSRGTAVASADADSTGTISPFADRRDASPASGLTLAYADQSAAPSGIAALRAAAITAQQQPAAQTPVNATTIAVKRVASQVASAVMTATATSLTVIKSGVNFENPWLRAVVLSPSVHRFLTTVALGERDFRQLAGLMVKPRNSVMMTFAADPNPGLDNDRFSGTAIVFVSTVNYQLRTASLQ
jgi:uncharacterized protein YcbK (DUF882 family)